MQLIESSVNNYYVTLNNEVISSINDMNNGIINEDEYLSNMSKISEQLDSYEEIQLLNDEENNYKRSVNKRGIYSSLKALTPEEIELYAKHPIKAAKAKDCADYAETSTAKNWSGYTTWQGNGDAYRHALWSALMSKEIDNDFSYRVGLAHEGLKKGYNIGKQNDDTKMDISNNYAGRKVGDKSSKSRGKIAKAIKNKCCKGGLRRIRTYTKNKKECDYVLDGVMTKYVGYYVATSDGGSK